MLAKLALVAYSVAASFNVIGGKTSGLPVEYGVDAFRTDHEAHVHLKRLARNEAPVPPPASTDAWSRLQALADDEGDL
jgi:hypothetical protein